MLLRAFLFFCPPRGKVEMGGMGGMACGIAPPLHPRATPRLMCKVKKAVSGHQILRDAPGFSHGEVSRCLRSRQSI